MINILRNNKTNMEDLSNDNKYYNLNDYYTDPDFIQRYSNFMKNYLENLSELIMEKVSIQDVLYDIAKKCKFPVENIEEIIKL